MRNKLIILGLLGGFIALLVFLVMEGPGELNREEAVSQQGALGHQSAAAISETESSVTRMEQEKEVSDSVVSVSTRTSSQNESLAQEGVTMLTGRILNLEGVVAKNKTLKARVQFHSTSVNETLQYSLRTGEDGRFRHAFPKDVNPESIKKFWVITGKSKNRVRRIASVDFLEPLPVGLTELGDMIVEAPPVLMEGTVVDEAGYGIPGAKLVLKRSRHAKDSLRAYDENRRNSRPQFQSRVDVEFWMQGGQWWEELSDLSVESDENGRFQIRGEFNNWDLHLEAKHGDFVDSGIEVGLGERNVQFTLGRSSKIQGRFLLDRPVRGKPMTIWMEREGPPGGKVGISLGGDGGFAFSDITPGVVHLTLKANPSDEVLFEWKDLLITSEEPVVQLSEIDLRGQLYAMGLKVVDSKGRAVRNVKVQLSSMDRPEKVRSNPFSLVSKAPLFSLSVGADKKRSQYLSEVSGHRIVELQAGFRARIVIDNFSELEKTSFMNILFLREGMQHEYAPRKQLRAEIDTSTGIMKHVFAEPGVFVVELYLLGLDPVTGDWAQRIMDENTIRPTIEILEVEVVQSFHISIDLDAIQRSRERLQGD